MATSTAGDSAPAPSRRSSAGTLRAPMPTAVGSAATAVGLDGTVYLAGGVDRATVHRIVQAYQLETNRWLMLPPLKVAAEVFDPKAGNWSNITDSPTPVTTPATAGAADGRICVFGGRTASTFLDVVEACSPATLRCRVKSCRFIDSS